ncbi:MAG: nicotinamide riboside transporter PnuC [Bacteroidales bacterium]
MMKLFSKSTLRLFDWFLIIGIIILNILYSVVENNFDTLGSIASITGVVCVVLVAKRSMSNYLFGIINVSLYAYISYESSLYGDFLLNALYYLPMQFIGWFMWFKDKGDLNEKGEMDMSIVKCSILKWKERYYLILGSISIIVLVGYILEKYTIDPQPYKDASTTILSVIAMFLMVKKFMEQWILWAVINIISVVMWLFVWISGGEHAGLMVAMYMFYLANSINGIIVWNNAANRDKSMK